MHARPAVVLSVFALSLAASIPAFAMDLPEGPASSSSAQWPDKARLLAAAMTSEYGAPDETAPGLLTWRGRPPWSLILVYRDAQSPQNPNNLQQSVAYDVPLRRWRALGAFERGVVYDPVKHELVARTSSEATNLLALNLADEVAHGKRTPQDANAFFDQTLELSAAGKSSPYMNRLLFFPGHRAPGPNGPDRDLEQEQKEILHFNGWK